VRIALKRLIARTIVSKKRSIEKITVTTFEINVFISLRLIPRE